MQDHEEQELGRTGRVVDEVLNEDDHIDGGQQTDLMSTEATKWKW